MKSSENFGNERIDFCDIRIWRLLVRSNRSVPPRLRAAAHTSCNRPTVPSTIAFERTQTQIEPDR